MKRDDDLSLRAAAATRTVSSPDESVFVNVYALDGSKFQEDEPQAKRAERTARLNFRSAAQHTAVVNVSSLHVGLSRPGASFFHLTKAVTANNGLQLGTVTFAIYAGLLGYMVPDLGMVPTSGSPEARAQENADGRPTAVTRCTPAGKAPGGREVFLVDRFGAVLMPNNCGGKDRFLFLDDAGRAAALRASSDEYDWPFARGRIDGTHGSTALMDKLRAAIGYEQRFFGSRRGTSTLWSTEEQRRTMFAGITPWDGRMRIFGMHPVREARSHGWHVIYMEDVQDAFAPLQNEHRNIFLGMIAAVLVASALMIAIVSFLMRQTKELHAGTAALAQGELHTRIRVLSGDELGQLADSFNTMAGKIDKATDQLEARNKFIRDAFGRYLTDEVVETLLASPEGLALGGESRTVTILMTDLRGFSAISDRLAPTQVVSVLNHYLRAMTEVIVKRGGTIDEFIGDAILVLFGAPVAREDHALRAVTCAVEMQRAMAQVNELNARDQLPQVEMGVGIHTGEVVVGNIGSVRRAKYGVVGKPVNLATRIESLTVGGQVLISKATLDAAGPGISVGEEMRVSLKGAQNEMSVFEVHGVHELSLLPPRVGFVQLAEPLVVRYAAFDGVHAPAVLSEASITAISLTQAVLVGTGPLDPRSTLKVQFSGGTGEFLEADAYAKVLREEQGGYLLHFTSMPPEVQELISSAVPAGL
ncbi:MAG: adenylate/guanylate cyclase domain-containing protein [Pseudomonadota bacterium]